MSRQSLFFFVDGGTIFFGILFGLRYTNSQRQTGDVLNNVSWNAYTCGTTYESSVCDCTITYI